MNLSQAIDKLVITIRAEERVRARAHLLAELGAKKSNGHSPNGARSTGYPRARASRVVTSRRRRKGEKRDPRIISGLTGRLGQAIQAKPGRRIEEIARALNASTKDLKLPVAKLFRAKAIRTKGVKRATRYYPR